MLSQVDGARMLLPSLRPPFILVEILFYISIICHKWKKNESFFAIHIKTIAIAKVDPICISD